jgi:hypothetical protein
MVADVAGRDDDIDRVARVAPGEAFIFCRSVGTAEFCYVPSMGDTGRATPDEELAERMADMTMRETRSRLPLAMCEPGPCMACDPHIRESVKSAVFADETLGLRGIAARVLNGHRGNDAARLLHCTRVQWHAERRRSREDAGVLVDAIAMTDTELLDAVGDICAGGASRWQRPGVRLMIDELELRELEADRSDDVDRLLGLARMCTTLERIGWPENAVPSPPVEYAALLDSKLDSLGAAAGAVGAARDAATVRAADTLLSTDDGELLMADAARALRCFARAVAMQDGARELVDSTVAWLPAQEQTLIRQATAAGVTG